MAKAKKESASADPNTNYPIYNLVKVVPNEQNDVHFTQMDPKLQQAVLLQQLDAKKLSANSACKEEIAVIARVKDADAWASLTEVRIPTVISRSNNGEIVTTGRIPVNRIGHIRRLPFVESLKAARKVKPTLQVTVPDIGANKFNPAISNQTGGRGVLIGIVDFGCDYAHRNFLNADGKTRIVQFWDQSAASTSKDVPYGRLYRSDEINKAIQQNDPYLALDYTLELMEHGTHVMDIAAGNGNGSGVPGVAPSADIIFVQPTGAGIPWEGPKTVEKNFGDSAALLEAVRYIFDQAGDQPCVVNISLGTNGGPHDGSSLVEKSIDGLLMAKPNRAVVIAAANSHNDGIHSSGNVPAAGSYDITWLVPQNDATENEMEIWYKGTQRLSVEVIDPNGKSLGMVDPSETGKITDAYDVLQLVISNRLNDPNNHDNVIDIWMKENNSGQWTVRLINKDNTRVQFHAWIESDNSNPAFQSSFGDQKDNSHTLGSISCGLKTITVGAYDATKTDFAICPFSGEGPTRDGRKKPEISAPGSRVRAAASTTITERTVMSGTSMSAPAVTGCIALLYAAAAAANKSLSIDDLRGIIMKKGRLQPPTAVWHPRFGFGRIFIPSMINHLLGRNDKEESSSPKQAEFTSNPQVRIICNLTI